MNVWKGVSVMAYLLGRWIEVKPIPVMSLTEKMQFSLGKMSLPWPLDILETGLGSKNDYSCSRGRSELGV